MVTVTALAAAMLTLTTTAGTAQADPAIPGTYNTVRPTRLLDTRAGLGTTKMPLAAGGTLSFDAVSGLPGPVGSVALTVTVVRPAGGGFLTVYPTGVTRPLASTINFVPTRTLVNSTVVPVGTGGNVSVYNGSNGTVEVIADITGWWTAGTVDPGTAGAVNTISPARLYDSRISPGVPARARVTTKVPVLGHGGVPSSNVSAVVVNVTVTSPKAAGYLTGGSEAPQAGSLLTATLSFQAGATRGNMAVLPLNPDGTVAIYNGSSGTSHIVVDVMGYFNDGPPAADGALVPTTVYRAADTRRESAGPIPALTTRTIQLLPNDGTALIFKALAVNITVTRPQSAGFITAWDGATPLPPTANNSFRFGEDAASATLVPINPDGTITVYNGSFGTLDVVVDVSGFVLTDLTLNVAKTGVAKASTASVLADAIARAKAFAARH
ncbi:hypothetical protein V3N99_05225 [Dermatophilaceae bacterium Soc4.6]